MTTFTDLPFKKQCSFLSCIFCVLFFTTTFLAADLIQAQQKHPRQYSIMEWSPDDGIASGNVTDIIQTRDGFLWVATDGGVSRFDGRTFQNLNRQSHPMLQSNSITSLLEDRKGNIWFGTHGGGLYTLTPDTLLRITDKQGLPSDYVLSLAEDSTGTIWVGTDGEGLGKVVADTVQKFSVDEGLERHIYSLAVDENNTLWIGGRTGLFYHSNGEFAAFDSEIRLPSPSILSLYPYEDQLYAGTPTGFGIIRDGKVIQNHVFEDPAYINSITIDKNGNTWIATLGDGIFKMTGDSAMQYTHENPDIGSNLNKVFTDNEGNIWAGTTQAGLIRFRNEIATTFTSNDGLPQNMITSVTEGDPGEFWIGTRDGLSLFSQVEVKTYVPGTTSEDRFVLSVHVDKNGTVWCGTASGKVFRMDDDQLIEIPLPSYEGMSVYAVHSTADGAILAASNRGLFRYHQGDIKRYSIENNELSNDDVRVIKQDQNGTTWVGTSLGLNALSNGDLSVYGSDEGLSDLLVISLHLDETGDIWAGTYGGLNRLRDGKATALTQEHGLPDDRISTILEDDYGFLWLGTARGILRFDKDTLNAFLDGNINDITFDSYDENDGMKTDAVTGTIQPTGWKANNGSLWFATSHGVTVLNPTEVTESPVPPQVHLTSTRVDRSDALPFRPVQPLELSRNHNEIEISFAAPSFINPSEINYRYKLEGLHSSWIEAGNRRSAYFSRIPPGEYTFLVTAANEEGSWNKSVASLPVTIRPPFWMTWWFISIAVIVFLSSGPIIYYRRVTYLKNKQQQQQHFTRRLIESQEAERNRIAGELHDSLGQNLIIIKNRAQLANKNGKNTDLLATQLEEISDTASSTIQEIRKISYNLRPVNLERFGLTQSISSMIRSADDSTEIDFDLEAEPINGLLLPENEIHLYRVIQEGVNNILKHSKATQCRLNISKKSGRIEVILSDNGIGFDKKKERSKNGFGLEDLSQRAGLLNGKLNIKSEPGKGSTISLTIPVQKKQDLE